MVEAKRYSALKYSLTLLDTAYLITFLFVFAGLGFSRNLSDLLKELLPNRISLISVYILIASIVYYVLSFPITFYRSYRLEHKFSLSDQKISDWFLDQLKSGVISYIIALILIGAFYYILGRFASNWWLPISLAWIFFSLIFAKLTPTLIIPIFFKYKKLSDETLRQRILNLADKMKVRILDCFEIDLSKKTLKANAAFVGVGKSRRVILADTLKDKYSYDEIEVILAHEFAHYKLKHLLKLIAVNSCVTLICFYLIFKSSFYALKLFGFSSLDDIAFLPVILIYFVLFGIIMQPIECLISRKLETNADRLALEVTGLKDAFISMMSKLSEQNLADKSPHPIIKFFFFDHPPVDERIKIAGTFPQVPC